MTGNGAKVDSQVLFEHGSVSQVVVEGDACVVHEHVAGLDQPGGRWIWSGTVTSRVGGVGGSPAGRGGRAAGGSRRTPGPHRDAGPR